MTRSEDVSEQPNYRVSGEFIRFLAYWRMDNRVNEVMDCGQFLKVRSCSGQDAHQFVNSWYCMNRGVCPVCDEIESWVQALDRVVLLAKLFNTVKRQFWVWRVDFTVGRDLWPKIPRDELPRFARVGYETMRQYFDKILGFKVRFGMDIAPQYWHSSAPGVGFYPHLHTVIPRLFVDAQTGRIATIDMPYLRQSMIKKLWRKNVEAVYGKSNSSFSDGNREMFSVRLTYYDHVGGSFLERLKYVYRGIAFDYEKWVNQSLDYSGWDREFVRWTLLSRHKRHVGYGLFAGKNLGPKSAFMRSIGLDYKTRMERERERRKKYCSECGALMGDPLHDVPLMSHKEAREKGLRRLKADFLSELKSEAVGKCVPY